MRCSFDVSPCAGNWIICMGDIHNSLLCSAICLPLINTLPIIHLGHSECHYGKRRLIYNVSMITGKMFLSLISWALSLHYQFLWFIEGVSGGEVRRGAGVKEMAWCKGL